MSELFCSICHLPIQVEASGWAGGHNAAPVNEGRCCRECNDEVVVPLRIKIIQKKMKEQVNGN